MTTESPFAIANFFLRLAKEEQRPITPMQLVKLVYIAHGWHLGLRGEPLICEPIQAWKYGPVVESIYHAFKQYKEKPISGAISSSTLQDEGNNSPLLKRVWDVYSKFTGGQLSTMTHAPNTPWSQVYKDSVKGLIIPNEIIKTHYREKLNAGRRQASQH